ncbi:MAG: hypothetical protein JWQ70_2536 [Aeromicrobium sp.]|nr:hypothetical protein [Aeromicrobium sp.]
MVAIAVAGGVLIPSSPASATYTVLCSGYSSCASNGYSNSGYSINQGKSYWQMYTGTNCTNYVAYRLETTNGMSNTRPKSGVGNANVWGKVMSSITNSTPVVGSVAWWGPSPGHHVAYVEKVVSSTEILVSESNWAGAFDWRRITKSGSGWPNGFIHFADLSMKNTAAPVVTGTPKVGSKLTASTGSWSPSPDSYTYSWLLDGDAISGATSKTYKPTASQVGHKISAAVTALRTSYPTTKAVSKTVTVAPGALTTSEPPTISGTPQVGQTLTASPGTWSPSDATYAYQWKLGGDSVSGATDPTWTPGPDAVGKTVTVGVTATKAGYTDVNDTSSATEAVATGPLTTSVKPAITGAAQVGSTLTATPGTWSKTGLTYDYQWKADGNTIDGATASTYKPGASDIDHKVTVTVTAAKTGYGPNKSTSSATDTVIPGTFTMSAAPSITGTAKVGSKLTLESGTWSHSPTLTYSWLADGTTIDGATGTTFVPTASEVGKRITARVSAARSGFTTKAAKAPETDAVIKGAIATSSSPRISGSTRYGSWLTRTGGDPTTSGTKVKRQWYRDGKAVSGATTDRYKITGADLAHKITVRLSYSASGRVSRSVTSKAVGPAQRGTSVAAKVSSKSGTVTFKVSITADGDVKTGGHVVISIGKTSVKSKVTDGHATARLTSQKAGSHTYTLHYEGTPTVASSHGSVKATTK